jgi:transcriptional regulator with XRE-family HTH domain
MRHADAQSQMCDAEARITRGLGQRIRMFRRLQQLSLADVGARLGLSGQMVHKYESGQSQLPACRLPRLAAALGVSTHLLLPGMMAVHAGRSAMDPEAVTRRVEAVLGHGPIDRDGPMH